MIDDYLGTVGKIAELCLPEAESVGIGLRVAKLISQDSEFRQMGVRCDELSTNTLWDGIIDGSVLAVLILVEDVSMSMREGTSLHILARDTYIETILDE